MDIDNVPSGPRDVFASQDYHRDSLRYLSDGVLHDQNIRHCPELSKILPESLLVSLPAQASPARREQAGPSSRWWRALLCGGSLGRSGRRAVITTM